MEPQLVLLLVCRAANFHLFGDKLLNLFNEAQKSSGSGVVTPSAVRAMVSAVRVMVNAVDVTRAVRNSAVIGAVFRKVQLMQGTWT